LALLKANDIKKIIASPGATNFCFVGSIQKDPYFEVYSCVDERSAAYMACGLAAESGEPVVLTCTGSTASRDYYPGLTEAYYRKLPILAITSHQGKDRIGHLLPQNIDRSVTANDVVRFATELPVVKDDRDESILDQYTLSYNPDNKQSSEDTSIKKTIEESITKSINDILNEEDNYDDYDVDDEEDDDDATEIDDESELVSEDDIDSMIDEAVNEDTDGVEEEGPTSMPIDKVAINNNTDNKSMVVEVTRKTHP
jgi:2-succinyl-5-enolpyruvyl-6-hydroxy-3-cyclohexene-1-carboxylate synthase